MPLNVVLIILWLCAVVWITAEIAARTRKLDKTTEKKSTNGISLEDFEK